MSCRDAPSGRGAGRRRDRRDRDRRAAGWRRLGAPLLACLAVAGCSVRVLLYPVPPVPVPSPPPPPLIEVELRPAGRPTVSAWWLAPPDLPPARPAVLFLHGNGENLETMRWAGLFDRLAALEVAALAIDYPGYGRSGGRPDEAGLLAAAATALESAAAAHPDRPLVVCGWSLGAAVAVQLAAGPPRPLAGLVAISPWTTLPELASLHFPSWLVGLALRERYDSLAAAPELELPALVVHGGSDRVIPAEHGRRLAAALPDARWLEIPEAGHNDLLMFERVWAELRRFLDLVAGG